MMPPMMPGMPAPGGMPPGGAPNPMALMAALAAARQGGANPMGAPVAGPGADLKAKLMALAAKKHGKK